MGNIIISTENIGKRLDKFLTEEFFDISRGEIIRQIKNGKVKINGEKIKKPSYRISDSEEIEVNFKITDKELQPNGSFSIPVIHEDENIIVINKPDGIQMHPSPIEKIHTIANWLIAKYPEISNVHDEGEEGQERPGMVHRLDKDTSGLVVIARKMEVLIELKRLFKERKVQKKYVALVYGHLEKKEGIINEPIARASNYKKQKIATGRVRGEKREAITCYEVLERFSDVDLVEVEPKTGRMHQIRVHLSSIGHPVVGDNKYARKEYKNHQILGVKRQLLHAKEVSFSLFQKEYRFLADIPRDFQGVLNQIN